MGKFYEFRAAKEPKTAEILVYGPIGSQGMFGSGDDITAKGFRQELDAAGDVGEINLYVNSPGGDPFTAQAIYSMLKRHKAHVTVYVDGLAASAASLLAMAGDTIVMVANGLMMIHEPRAISMGTADEMRSAAEALDRVGTAMAVAYADKSGKPQEDVLAVMKAETWFTAQEAVDAGFADEVEGERRIAASLQDGTLTINGQQVDLSAFRAFPAEKVAESFLDAGKALEPLTAAAEELLAAEPAEVEQEPTEAPAADEQEEAAPAQDEKQARLKLLRLRART